MDTAKVLEEFRAADALLEGHFVLSSGKHSDRYLQCARVMMDPARGARLLGALAKKIHTEIEPSIDLIISPAMGGVIVGYELARHLEVPAVFMERVDGAFVLRRGFDIPKGANVLMMEDIVTTGLSSRECIEAIRNAGGNVVGGACLIDRSNGKADIGVKLVPLLGMEVTAYDPENLPDHLIDTPAVKPGSRGLKS
jgi:orotate phosphoribosyltransferase